ncbi:MAG: glutamyl-tRNA amidotransferase [Oscillospiraceae bacterium]
MPKIKIQPPCLLNQPKILKWFSGYIAIVIFTMCATTVCAADDPIAVVNNLSNFIFGLVRAIGMILIGYGIVQIGLSLKSHDPSQRANGIMTVAGGIVVTFAKEILNTIAG